MKTLIIIILLIVALILVVSVIKDIIGYLLDMLIEIQLKHYSNCYDTQISMEHTGCYGLAGGDRSTNWLQYECFDCPYHVWPPEERVEEKENG